MHMKKCWMSSAIRELQIKITMRYLYKHIKMTKIKKYNTKYCLRYREIGSFINCRWDVKQCNCYRRQFGIFL